MGIIQNSIIINNNKNVGIAGVINIKGIAIQGKVPYKISTDVTSNIYFNFVDLSNISVIDGVWDKQNELIYNTESVSTLTPNIFFDFENLSNISVIDGVWNMQSQLIYNTEISLPIELNIFFDFGNLSNLTVFDGVWDKQGQLIFNTEVN